MLQADQRDNNDYPHILLVDAVGDPQVAIGRRSVTLLNATHILRSERFVLTGIAHRRHLAIDEVEGRVLQAIFRE